MSSMIGLQSLLVLPLLAAPVAFQGTNPVTITTESLLPLGVVLILAAAVWRASSEFQKLTSTLKRLMRRMDRVEAHVGLPTDPDAD